MEDISAFDQMYNSKKADSAIDDDQNMTPELAAKRGASQENLAVSIDPKMTS